MGIQSIIRIFPYLISIFIFIACTQGGLNPAGPMGGLDGNPSGFGVGSASGESETSEGGQEDEGDGSSGTMGVFSANPTMDAGDVNPVHDVPVHPPAIFGEGNLLCNLGGGKVKMKIEGHVAHAIFPKGSSEYVDYDVGSGRTLRLVNLITMQYMEVPVLPYSAGEGPWGDKQLNQFEISFTTQFPIPTIGPADTSALKFYLSDREHQSSDYGKIKECPKWQHQVMVVHDGSLKDSKGSPPPQSHTCAPNTWINPWSHPIFLDDDLYNQQVPPCLVAKEAIKNTHFISQ